MSAPHLYSRRGLIALCASFALAGSLAACSSAPADSGSAGNGGSSPREAVELQVFAANSLEKALPEVQRLYTEQTGVTFADTQFKASGDLVEQMRAGAQVDALITASTGTMEDALSAQLVNDATCRDMFVNDLVIAKAEGSDVALTSIDDVRNLDGRIAIGDAATVPAGKYANQALASVGLYSNAEGVDGEYGPAIADKIALADKVGTAAKYVSTGDCLVGFVYSSDIYRYDGIEEAFVCPEDSHKPIVYPGAVATASAHTEEAEKFLEFCLANKDAQKVWAKYGFELAE